MYPSIVVIKRNGMEGGKFDLEDDEVIFGRHSECDIRIALPQVSKHHAKLNVNKNGEVWVTNLSKVNTTDINDRSINAPTLLKAGDVIKIHDRSFRIDIPTGFMATDNSPRRILGVRNTSSVEGSPTTKIDHALSLRKNTPRKAAKSPGRSPSQARSSKITSDNSNDENAPASPKTKSPQRKRSVSPARGELRKVPTPLRQAIEKRRLSASDEFWRADVNAAQKQAAATSPVPFRFSVESEATDSQKIMSRKSFSDETTGSSGLEDVTGRLHDATSESKRSFKAKEEQEPGISFMLSPERCLPISEEESVEDTPEEDTSVADHENDDSANVVEAPRALNSPLRRQIQARRRRSSEGGEDVPAPVGAKEGPATEKRRRRSSVASAKSSKADDVLEDNTPAERAVRPKLSTPMREQIASRRRRSSVGGSSGQAEEPSASAAASMEVDEPANPPAPKSKKLATPLKKQIETRRRRSSVGTARAASETAEPPVMQPAEDGSKPLPRLASPLRRAIQSRRKSVSKDAASMEVDEPANPPAAKSNKLATPLKKQIESRRRRSSGTTLTASETTETTESPRMELAEEQPKPLPRLASPLRRAIQSRRKSVGKKATAGETEETACEPSTASKTPQRATRRSPAMDGLGEPKLATPLRKEIESRRRRSSASVPATETEQKNEEVEADAALTAQRKLGTPLRNAICSRRPLRSVSAANDTKNDSATEVSVAAELRRRLASPLRKDIETRGRRRASERAQAASPSPSSSVNESKPRASPGRPKKLATPLRKQIEARAEASTASPIRSDAKRLRSKVLAAPDAAFVAPPAAEDGSAARPRLASPLRRQIETRGRRSSVGSVLAVGSEPRTPTCLGVEPMEIDEEGFRTPRIKTPIRKEIEARRRKSIAPEATPTPSKKSGETEKEESPKTPRLATPVRKQIHARRGASAKAAKKLPTPIRMDIGKRSRIRSPGFLSRLRSPARLASPAARRKLATPIRKGIAEKVAIMMEAASRTTSPNLRAEVEANDDAGSSITTPQDAVIKAESPASPARTRARAEAVALLPTPLRHDIHKRRLSFATPENTQKTTTAKKSAKKGKSSGDDDAKSPKQAKTKKMASRSPRASPSAPASVKKSAAKKSKSPLKESSCPGATSSPSLTASPASTAAADHEVLTPPHEAALKQREFMKRRKSEPAGTLVSFKDEFSTRLEMPAGALYSPAGKARRSSILKAHSKYQAPAEVSPASSYSDARSESENASGFLKTLFSPVLSPVSTLSRLFRSPASSAASLPSMSPNVVFTATDDLQDIPTRSPKTPLLADSHFPLQTELSSPCENLSKALLADEEAVSVAAETDTPTKGRKGKKKTPKPKAASSGESEAPSAGAGVSAVTPKKTATKRRRSSVDPSESPVLEPRHKRARREENTVLSSPTIPRRRSAAGSQDVKRMVFKARRTAPSPSSVVPVLNPVRAAVEEALQHKAEDPSSWENPFNLIAEEEESAVTPAKSSPGLALSPATPTEGPVAEAASPTETPVDRGAMRRMFATPRAAKADPMTTPPRGLLPSFFASAKQAIGDAVGSGMVSAYLRRIFKTPDAKRVPTEEEILDGDVLPHLMEEPEVEVPQPVAEESAVEPAAEAAPVHEGTKEAVQQNKSKAVRFAAEDQVKILKDSPMAPPRGRRASLAPTPTAEPQQRRGSRRLSLAVTPSASMDAEEAATDAPAKTTRRRKSLSVPTEEAVAAEAPAKTTRASRRKSLSVEALPVVVEAPAPTRRSSRRASLAPVAEAVSSPAPEPAEPKVSATEVVEEAQEVDIAAPRKRASRRKSLAVPAEPEEEPVPTRRSSRRCSIAASQEADVEPVSSTRPARTSSRRKSVLPATEPAAETEVISEEKVETSRSSRRKSVMPATADDEVAAVPKRSSRKSLKPAVKEDKEDDSAEPTEAPAKATRTRRTTRGAVPAESEVEEAEEVAPKATKRSKRTAALAEPTEEEPPKKTSRSRRSTSASVEDVAEAKPSRPSRKRKDTAAEEVEVEAPAPKRARKSAAAATTTTEKAKPTKRSAASKTAAAAPEPVRRSRRLAAK
eukprot:Rmarinus@m.1410